MPDRASAGDLRLSAARLTDFYRTMLRIRLFEEQVADLVESGDIGTPCHLYIGQEAVATGVCSTLEQTDYVWGGHRSHGHYLAKGGAMPLMMAEIFGRKTGCAGGRGGSMHLLAVDVGILGTVPLVAATIPLAVGAAMASKLRGDRRVSVSFFGDGATEEGHFHESVNMAALYKLPVLFICENNFYASHMSLLERRPADNIAKTGEAHAIPSYSCDGNDVTEVYRLAAEAVDRGRAGGGPTLIECRTYRWRGHVGASWNLDVGVKRSDELKEWLPRDPIVRLKGQLLSAGVTPEDLNVIESSVRAEIADSLRFAKESPLPEPSELSAHLFVEGKS